METRLASGILNTMTRQGMPDRYRVEWISLREMGDLPSTRIHAPTP